jgi:hypothetical protein
MGFIIRVLETVVAGEADVRGHCLVILGSWDGLCKRFRAIFVEHCRGLQVSPCRMRMLDIVLAEARNTIDGEEEDRFISAKAARGQT